MHGPVYAFCMATKTISVDLEAYECLRRARLAPTESFSRVIKRARWDPPPFAAEEFLAALAVIPVTEPEVIERLERAQVDDRPPGDSWQEY